MVLFGGPPLIWGYMCRSSGTWCEGSYVPPRVSDDGRKLVAEKILTEPGDGGFTGLSVRRAGFWPIGTRLDVIANFSNGQEVAIDTLPDDHTVQVYQSPTLSIAALTINSHHRVRIISYFPRQKLTKRIFELGAAGLDNLDISVSNLSYDEAKKRLVFDLQSSFPWLRVNDNQETLFQLSGNSSDKIYGATVALTLSETLHAQSVFPISNEEEFSNSESRYQSCKAAFASEQHEEGDLFACRRTQTDDLSVERGSLTILEWRNGNVTDADIDNCTWPGWVLDPSKKLMFVTCNHSYEAGAQGENAHTNLWLSIYKRPFDEITYFFEGDCRDISIFNIRTIGRNSLVFELATSCDKLSVNDHKFDLTRSPDGKGLRATYKLELDGEGLPLSLKPFRS